MKNTTFILCCLFCAALLQNVGAQSPSLSAEIDKLLSEQYKAEGTNKITAIAADKSLTRAPIREVTFTGSGYKRGLQHGQQLKKEIGEIVAKWKKT